MKETLSTANSLAQRHGGQTDTGHLMLALVSGNDSAGQLLRHFGLTESKIRYQLRSIGNEPESLIKSVLRKAQRIEKPVKLSKPTSLHLLIALLNNKECNGVGMLRTLNVNLNDLSEEAMRCLTSASQGRGVRSKQIIAAQESGQALPLLGNLNNFTTQKSNRKKQQEKGTKSRDKKSVSRVNKSVKKQKRIAARALIGAGAEIEQKQRAKRVSQTNTKTDCPFSDAVQHGSQSATSTNVAENNVAENPAPIFEFSKEQFPLLSELGRNLVEEALDGKIDQIVGREQEMEKIADVLNRRRANCPCIIGPSGVGKTALVEGLASKLAHGEAPGLDDRHIIEIRPANILAGTSVRGALAERLEQLRKEVAAADGRVVLFIDEIHALLTSNDGHDAVQEIKSAIGKGEFPCIAATTDQEYAKYVEADPALARRFTKVVLDEPEEEEAVRILKGIVSIYEAHHQVAYTDEALLGAVKLSTRYLNDRALPDKAIALLDTAGARVRRVGGEFVEKQDIAEVLAEQIGVPPERLITSNQDRLLTLEASLSERIVGHRNVLSALGETLRRNAAGFRSGRPIGSFLFLGPTGVGKTETAKALGDLLFLNDRSLIRIDMSEFREAHAVARLVGAPPGYVGHEEGGQLTEAVRRQPYSLVLLDEIEKAHPEVLQLLLQVLDDGRLTDGLGRTVSFENTIVIMTSNLGANLGQQQRAVGFGAARSTEELGSVSEQILKAVRNTLPPELWNRVDELLVFEPLGRNDALNIAELMLVRISEQLTKENDIALEIGEGLLESLADLGGFDPEFGARPMRRTIQKYVEGPVARMILEGTCTSHDTVVGTGDDETVAFTVKTTRKVRPAS